MDAHNEAAEKHIPIERRQKRNILRESEKVKNKRIVLKEAYNYKRKRETR